MLFLRPRPCGLQLGEWATFSGSELAKFRVGEIFQISALRGIIVVGFYSYSSVQVAPKARERVTVISSSGQK